MKTQYLKLMLGALLCATFSFAVVAEPQATMAGKVEFQDMSNIYGAPKVEINLSKALIGMVGAFAQNQDPEISGILSKIEDITVRVYNVGADKSAAMNEVEKLTKQLRNDKWEPFVSVNEDLQKVRIFGKTTDGIMDGLVVMVVGADENAPQTGENQAVFINIVGQVDPSQVGKVTKALNIQ